MRITRAAISKCLGDFFWNFSLLTGLAYLIITFRLPSDKKIKEKWIEVIENANHIQFRGSGMICLQHFQDEEFKKLNNRLTLQKDTVPSVFPSDSLIEIIHVDDDFNSQNPEPICESCKELKHSLFIAVTEHESYKTNVEVKLNKLINSKNEKIAELTNKIARMESDRFKLQNKYSKLIKSQHSLLENNDKVHIILINS